MSFGDGSSSFDIILPCGGISVAIHLVRDVGAVLSGLERRDVRQQAALVYSPASQTKLIANQRLCGRGNICVWDDVKYLSFP
ncbi:hypothetical protein FHT86_001027 [Rhizobium sp. BK313]|nr:hypothetical protein [Rhizobium sp. BK313]